MSDSDFWQRLQEDWQAASPPVDLAVLRRQVHRKRRRMQALQLLDVVAGLAATGFLVVAMRSVHEPHLHLLFVLLLVVVWGSIAVGAWLRRSTWKPQGTDAESLLRLSIRRARAGIGFVWLNVVGMPVVYAIVLPFFWHIFSTGSPAQRRNLWGGVAVNAGFYALVIVWAVWYGRRQRRKLKQARALLEQLENETGGER